MENKEYIFWYYNPDCQAFIEDLLKDLNFHSQEYYSSTTNWENSSYHNDSCGSVHFNYDNDTETYVQLFAFHNQDEATKEGIQERFSIQTVIHGKEQLIEVGSNIPNDGSTCLIMNDRDEAIREALEAVSVLLTKV
tara:strand:+ start:2563 stop:2970 length:408 start_codon:yes stop_codon:yes gene_type:complete